MFISKENTAIALTAAELKLLEAQAQQQGEIIYQTTEFGSRVKLPRKLGEAGDRIFQLKGGQTLWEHPILAKKKRKGI